MSNKQQDKQIIIENAALEAANHMINAMKAANAEKRISTVLGSPEGDYVMNFYMIDPAQPEETPVQVKANVKSDLQKMIQECTIFALGEASTDGAKLKLALEEYIKTLENGEEKI